MTMFSRQFWADAAERAIKTGAQAAIAAFGVGSGLFDVDWQAALSMTGGAMVLSVLTSVASSTKGDVGTASMLDTGGPVGRHAAGTVHVIDEDQDEP